MNKCIWFLLILSLYHLYHSYFHQYCPTTLSLNLLNTSRRPSNNLFARTGAPYFENDVCKCSTFGRVEIIIGNLRWFLALIRFRRNLQLAYNLGNFTRNHRDFKWYSVTLRKAEIHFGLTCIIFRVGKFTALNVNYYYIYGGVRYYIEGWFLLHLWLVLHLGGSQWG